DARSPGQINTREAGRKIQHGGKLVFSVISSGLQIVHLSRHRRGIRAEPIEGQIQTMATVIHSNTATAVTALPAPMRVPFLHAFCMSISISVECHRTNSSDSTAVNNFANRLDDRRMLVIVTGKDHPLHLPGVIEQSTSL